MNLNSLPVFPCNTAKQPIIAGGFKSARRGASADGWPLIGFATGAASGIDVLDVDPTGNGWYGANFDALPQTRAHQTQRGLHLLFKHADGLRCSTSRIAPGIDVRADGGYAIWWPREGLPIEDWPICRWSDWLLREAMGGKASNKRFANRCLAAYRRLLRRGRFVQPQSGLALLQKVKAAVSPYAAFMETYWDADPMGDGILVKHFAGTFRHWCMQTERLDLVKTSGSNIIQQINKIPKWRYVKSFRPASNEARRYRVKLKAGMKIPAEVLRGEYDHLFVSDA